MNTTAERKIFLDTETTGLYPATGDRLVEIGCLESIDGELTGKQFHQYVNPQFRIHERALEVHGLDSEFLEDKPLFSEIAQDLLCFVHGAEVVIHNARFDMAFLDVELARLALGNFSEYVVTVTDSLALARKLYPGLPNNLDAICCRLGVANNDRRLHGALLDAKLLANVYFKISELRGY